MNDTITGHNIGGHYIRSTAIEVDLNATFFSFYEINRFATNGFHRASSNGGGRYFSSNNMPQDNGLLLLIGQRGQNLRVNFGKSIIRRSKNSQSFSSLQGVNQAQIADNRDQSFKRTSAYGNINNVSKRFFFF